MASEIKVTNIKANDGTASLTIANSNGNLTNAGTLTSTGAITASGGIANAGTITAGTINSGVVMVGPINKNIYATTNISSSANQTTIKITADKLTVYDTSNNFSVLSSVDVSPAITASGANGLDTGSEATSTWYYYYVIYDGSTTAGLLSASSSSPTMPSGYTYKKFIGAIYNQSGGDLVELYQKGGHCFTFYGTQLSHNNIGSGSPSANTQTAINPTAFIPPNADFYKFRFQGDTGSTATVNIHFNSGAFLRQSSATAASQHIGNSQNYIYTDSNSSTQLGGVHTLPMITAQTFYVNPIYAVGTMNLFHISYQFLGVE